LISTQVKAIVQKLEPGLADDEIDALIKEADEDGDGHIDYEEFSKILLNKDAGDHERVQVTKVKRKIATHEKKDVRLGASADESKDSAH
jgi:predicted RNA-binding protein with TRAM domain